MEIELIPIKQKMLEAMPDYPEAKQQAVELDQLLGFGSAQIEEQLKVHGEQMRSERFQQFWFGLDLQSLQTPYSEIVTMLKHIGPKPGDLWLDLGAGYGRMGIVLGMFYPDVKFIGYEFVPERVAEANRIYRRWNLNNASIKRADISSAAFSLEPAEVYFIYDFGSKRDVYRVLEKLGELAKLRPIKVIARGRGVRNWILKDFPWLGEVEAPEHFGNWSLFRS